METLLKDVRYGVRMLIRKPGFTVVAVIALALGIGANAAIFSVVNAVLLRPLPYEASDRLMMIRETKLPQFPEFSVSPGNFLDWQKQNEVFERMVAIQNTSANLVDTSGPERLLMQRVTNGFLTMLGAKPWRGRDFLAEEDQPGHNRVVLISYGLWQRRFGGSPDIVDRSINLDGQSYTIVGVMPSTFKFGGPTTDLWAPMGFGADAAEQRGGHYLQAIGRLKPGIPVERARAEMMALADRIAEAHPDPDAGWNVKVVPLLDYAVRSVKPALTALLIAVGFVLLIACANVANLLLARAADREKEIAIRTALGADRWRIVRQMLTESLLLSLAGGAVGMLLAVWGVHVLLSFAPDDLPRMRDVSVDGSVFAFTLGIALLTGFCFGLVPALQASKPNLNETLKDAGRGSTEGRRRHLVRSILVVVEVATSLVLLVGAGLMLKSFVNLRNVDPGFNPGSALTAAIALPRRKYADNDKQAAFYRTLIEKVAALPGVESVGASNVLPLDNDYVLGFQIQGRPPAPAGQMQSTNYYAVSADYFKAMGIPLRRGRVFTDLDTKGTQRVAVINEAMATKYFPDEDPIGKYIHVTNGPETYRQIVGVVGDVKHYGLDRETPPETYEPFLQQPFTFMSLVVRTAGDPTSFSSAIREQVLSIDSEQPVSSIRPLAQLVSASLAQQRLSMLLMSVFAGVALALATVGLYGVMSYTVTQRTHEIGIRRALGAAQPDVLKLIIGHGMLLTMIGVAVGLVLAFAGTRLMSSLLFAVSATDLATFVLLPAVLATVALMACLVPAWRALKVDPMVALRYE